MKGYTKHKCRIVRFDNVQEMLENALTLNKLVNSYIGKVISSDTGYGAEWLGIDINSADELREMCAEKWSDSIVMFEGLREEVAGITIPPPKSKKKKKEYSDQEGEEIDIDKFTQGEENFWIRSGRESIKGPQEVVLVIEASIPGNVEIKAGMWRGVAGVVLADILEEHGYTVEMQLIDYCTRPYDSDSYKNLSPELVTELQGIRFFANELVIKKSGDPLNIATLMNTLSTWYFRTVMLQSMDELLVDDNGQIFVAASKGRGGHTQLSGMSSELKKELVRYGWSNVRVIENIWSKDKAIQKIKGILKELEE